MLQWAAAAVWATSAALKNNLILETWDMYMLHVDRKTLISTKSTWIFSREQGLSVQV